MTPQVKATITLPVVVAAGITLLILLSKFPTFFVYLIIGVSILMIMGTIWYGLYVSFGGEE
jgi:hypothetical protein